MKKLFALFVIAATVASCGNNADNTTSDVKDSALEKVDSIGDARVDSVKEATDSLQNTVEATFDKTDSANKANADSTQKK